MFGAQGGTYGELWREAVLLGNTALKVNTSANSKGLGARACQGVGSRGEKSRPKPCARTPEAP